MIIMVSYGAEIPNREHNAHDYSRPTNATLDELISDLNNAKKHDQFLNPEDYSSDILSYSRRVKLASDKEVNRSYGKSISNHNKKLFKQDFKGLKNLKEANYPEWFLDQTNSSGLSNYDILKIKNLRKNVAKGAIGIGVAGLVAYSALTSGIMDMFQKDNAPLIDDQVSITMPVGEIEEVTEYVTTPKLSLEETIKNDYDNFSYDIRTTKTNYGVNVDQNNDILYEQALEVAKNARIAPQQIDEFIQALYNMSLQESGSSPVSNYNDPLSFIHEGDIMMEDAKELRGHFQYLISSDDVKYLNDVNLATYTNNDYLYDSTSNTDKNIKLSAAGFANLLLNGEKEVYSYGDRQTYTVQKGDNISDIAKDLGMSVDMLMQYNPDIKDSSKIQVGQEIGYKDYMVFFDNEAFIKAINGYNGGGIEKHGEGRNYADEAFNKNSITEADYFDTDVGRSYQSIMDLITSYQ